MSAAPKHNLYVAVRWAGMLAAVAACAAVMGHVWRTLPVGDVLFLALLGALVRFRPLEIALPAAGGFKLNYLPGEGVFIIALLRDGPACALAVVLLASLASVPLEWARSRARSLLVRHPLEAVDSLFSFPVLFWLLGVAYGVLGGHGLRTAADSGLFFQNPLRIVLPLLLSLAGYDLAQRLGNVLTSSCWRGSLVLSPLAGFKTYALGAAEVVCGALGLALWTVWGWSTLPFSLLIAGTAMLATRNYLERVEARRDADSDPLTGLASWRGLENFLRRRIADSKRTGDPFAVLFLDADGLKRVNDQWGHAAGDELLTLIGDCCRRHARACDLVGRRGGDEFLLVLAGLGRDGGEAVRGRLQRAVEERLAGHARFAGLAGVSAGLAVFPDDAETANALVATADARMYADKQGRKHAAAA